MRVIKIVGEVRKDSDGYKIGRNSITIEDILKIHEGKNIEIDIRIIEND